MELYELIAQKTNTVIPIYGENPHSIDTPLRIDRNRIRDYVAAEYAFVRQHHILLNADYEVVGQQLTFKDEKSIDTLIVKRNYLETGISEVVRYYFDFSDNGTVGFSNTNEEVAEAYLIETFFDSLEECVNFCNDKEEQEKYSAGGFVKAKLNKYEEDMWTYELTSFAHDLYIGEYVIPFEPTKENLRIFNGGCKEMAERLRILFKVKDMGKVPQDPPPFGVLTGNK